LVGRDLRSFFLVYAHFYFFPISALFYNLFFSLLTLIFCHLRWFFLPRLAVNKKDPKESELIGVVGVRISAGAFGSLGVG